MFNYATGPVEMESHARQAMIAGPMNSHASAGQEAVTRLLERLRIALAVPEEFDLLLIPGSIRQALQTVIDSLLPPDGQALSLATGYWGSFIGDLMLGRGAKVTQTASLAGHESTSGSLRSFDLVTAVHMETETGLMEDLRGLARFKSSGALVLVDAACTVPFHDLDYDVADVVVLGSHKCLGGPPGLAIVAIRATVPTDTPWQLSAYRADGRARRLGAAMPAPLVTYPLELVLGLDAALESMLNTPDPTQRRVAAARRLRASLLEQRFDVVTSHRMSHTVTRINFDADVDVVELRRRLGQLGYFVIGNVGASSSGSIRVGTMSAPQVDFDNVDRFVAALISAREHARSAATTHPLPQTAGCHD